MGKRVLSVTCGLDVNVFIHGNQVKRSQRVEVLQAQFWNTPCKSNFHHSFLSQINEYQL